MPGNVEKNKSSKRGVRAGEEGEGRQQEKQKPQTIHKERSSRKNKKDEREATLSTLYYSVATCGCFLLSNTTKSIKIPPQTLPPCLPASLPPSLLISAYHPFSSFLFLYLGIVKRGTEEEVAVRLVKARDDREPKVVPGLMALQGEGGREGGRRVSKCAGMRGKRRGGGGGAAGKCERR